MVQTDVHGASTYSNLGCRCDTCKAANTARIADYRARRRARRLAASTVKAAVSA